MPILLVYYHCDLNDETIFLGVCEYTKRKDFEIKMKAWCECYEMDFNKVQWKHGYLNTPFRSN